MRRRISLAERVCPSHSIYLCFENASYFPGFRYWQDKEQTEAVMRRHPGDPDTLWMHTGDTGIMDEEGYLSGQF